MKVDRRFCVYNLYDFIKRDLYLDNYNDDVESGLVFFSRDSLEIVKDNFLIIGYCVIDKKSGEHYPIDVLEGKISFFEGSFNCFGNKFKEKMLKYNIETQKPFFSDFLEKWQFLCDFSCFDTNYFYSLSSYIIGNSNLVDKCKVNNLHIYYPSSYLELCYIVKNIICLFDMDYMNMDFLDEYKQLLYSFENKILINFNDDDIYIYFENFCKIILHFYRKENL